MPWIAPVVMAALAATKSLAVDAPRAERQRKLAAETARYSPWTGMSPQGVQEADPFGATLQGGASGMAMSQNMDAAKAAQATQGAQNNLLNAQADYFRGGSGQPIVPMAPGVGSMDAGNIYGGTQRNGMSFSPWNNKRGFMG